MTIGCHLPSNGVFQDFPEGKKRSSQPWERGLGTPGCLTSEDEERETWTAESLRVSIFGNLGFKELGFSGVEAGRKTSAVHVYIGYTIVVRDVNRVQLIWWDLVKRCDQPVQSFKSNLRV